MANDFLSDLREEAMKAIAAATCGVTVDASEIANDIVRRVQQKHQGEEPYIPGPQKYDPAAVMRDFNYRNHAEVCRRHGISRSTLKRLVRKHTESKRAAAGGPVSP